MKSLAIRILLCFILAKGVNANSITYQQINQQPQNPTSGATVKSNDPSSATVQGEDKIVDFVRLSDGRIVPYGPGVLCSEACIQTDILDNTRLPRIGGRLNPWFVTVPVVTAGILTYILMRGGEGQTPTALLDTTTPAVVTPPQPPGADVPEPATWVLLGIGLAMIARQGVGKRERRKV